MNLLGSSTMWVVAGASVAWVVRGGSSSISIVVNAAPGVVSVGVLNVAGGAAVTVPVSVVRVS